MDNYFPRPYKELLDNDEVSRPHYGFCVYNAANLAVKLGYPKISVIELGVAGGNGLMNLEYHIEKIKKDMNIDIELYGFDMETGLPKSDDYRDLLYLWREGFHKMDREKLESRLKFAKLVIGDVKITSQDFFSKYKPAPLGAVLVDLDYYSSTINAFQLFNTDSNNYLPRIYCYFDDIIGTNEFVGQLCAIKEFNDDHEHKKIAKIYGLHVQRRFSRRWNEQIFCFHDFKHPKYNQLAMTKDAPDNLSI
jgi:hypothetical protein